MIEASQKRLSKSNKYLPVIRNFYEGRLYPFLVASMVLIGHITALELYFAIVILLSAAHAFFICDTVKPFLPTALTFVYIVNIEHTPGMPTWSDYYKQPYVVITAVILFSLLFISAIYFTVKHIVPVFSARKAPLFVPLILLSAAFILNGAFAPNWSFASLLYGAAQAAVFFFIFYLFYYGLKKENTNELLDHISYLALLSAMVLVGEIINMFLTNDSLLNAWGTLVKENFNLGWGISNPIGFCLILLIPILIRGTVKCRFKYVYLFAAIAVSFATFSTLSRNAMLFGALFLAISFILALIKDKPKWPYVTIAVLGALAIGVIVSAFRERLYWLLVALLRHGFSDSGRFALWESCWTNFTDSPIFGKGFFDWGDAEGYIVANFLPNMAHNTVFQLLSSMGIVGLIAYLIYRVRSLAPFLKRITFEKIMMLLPILITIGTSLLDNFMFYFYTTFIYQLMLAVAFKTADDERAEKLRLESYAKDILSKE